MNVFDIAVSKKAIKQLKRLPTHVVVKLQGWVGDVQLHGLRAARKQPGFHDEPLQGKRLGQRSIRLSKAYRAIYHIVNKDQVSFAEILEVTKHEY